MPVTFIQGQVAAAGGAVSYTDDFNRSNENLDASANWTRVGGSAGDCTVSSNKMACITTNDVQAYYDNRLDSVNAYAQGYFVSLPGTNSWSVFALAVRLSTYQNFVGIRFQSPNVQLYKRVGGSLTQLAQVSNSIAATDLMRVEASGDNARVLKNGAEIITWTSLGGSLSTNSRAGVVPRSIALNPALDDWECGSL